MSSEKKGFDGLHEMVSDISGDLPGSTSRESPSHRAEPASEAKSEPQSVSHSNSSSTASTSQPPSPPVNTPPSGGGGGGWVIGIVVVLAILVLALGSGSRKDTPSTNSQITTSAPPAPSIYALGIPEISTEQDRLIASLMQVSQSSESTAIGNAVSALEGLSSKTTADKAALKESRAKNKIGLQHIKENHDELAVKEFYSAFKLNSSDAEIADNLGYVLYNLGDYVAAKKAFLFSLAHSARRASAWGGLAKVLAINNLPEKSNSAFSLAFHFSKSPKTLRQSLITSYRDEKIPAVKNAVGTALAAHYSLVVAPFLKTVLGNLANVEIPVLLPTKYSPTDFDGKPQEAFVLNNEMFGIQVSTESYHIPVGSEADCRAMACGIGAISARRSLPADTDEGEPVELEGGIKGFIVKGTYRETDHLVFRIGGIRYAFNIGSSPSANVDAANTALKLGSIPNEILVQLPKMPLVSPPPTQPISQQPTIISPTPAPTTDTGYARTPSNPYCTTTFSISLETFGEGVTVELRSGTPGSSRAVDVAQSSGGIVRFSGLCAGSYFLAIGNSDSVSVTPVRNFDNGMEYSSSIRMQRGSGNVSTRRRNDL